MKFAKVTYKGADERIGRFNQVKTGEEILLTPSEYECVREDPRYEFIDWEEVDTNPRKIDQPTKLGRAKSVTSPDEKSPGVPDTEEVEASRVSQDVSEDIAIVEDVPVEEQEGLPEEGEDGYEDLTVSDLKAEIDVRNDLLKEEGEDPIVPESGLKADLISALRKNDEDELEG